MALENAYSTMEAVQRETGNSNPELVSWFEDCVNLASRWIDDYCHCEFLPHSYPLDGPSPVAYRVKRSEMVGGSIFLPWPIVNLSQVKTGIIILREDDYFWEEGSREILLPTESLSAFQPTDQAVIGVADFGGFRGKPSKWDKNQPTTVNGEFGYASVPSSVARACTQIASAWSHEKRRERMAMDGKRTSLLDENIPEDARILLRRFRRLVA